MTTTATAATPAATATSRRGTGREDAMSSLPVYRLADLAGLRSYRSVRSEAAARREHPATSPLVVRAIRADGRVIEITVGPRGGIRRTRTVGITSCHPAASPRA